MRYKVTARIDEFTNINVTVEADNYIDAKTLVINRYPKNMLKKIKVEEVHD